MSNIGALTAMSRGNKGTGPARALRRADMVPGIIYGDRKEPEMIAVNFKALAREHQSSNFFSKVFTLEINGKKQEVIAKDIQLHPVSDAPLHVDFQRINKDSKVNLFLPVTFINEEKSPAMKRGGALNVIIHSLEITCSPHMIPENLVVDLSGVEMHQSILIEHLKLPQGAQAAHPVRDNVLATIVAPSGTTDEEKTA
ncbi:50S ribosomal protein L25/general stress protein Ctc [Candidatus Finniella inopinata]|uniref:Large ribosomal subunit protein bL25 n=1 Tax=Candidatus Finniella inopinata TaxID=1696036 RepID=A0A4Q7DID3_9PROT|nr:50S ribosomal protein L25/general stress protein Ctc [Candidatus Finniella inopinata]RZI46110.1 50S ribosomal protein L25/general stress protein Ctc [Candidatus Finniella inopinata]